MAFSRRQFLQSLAASVAALGLVDVYDLSKPSLAKVLAEGAPEPVIVWHEHHLLHQFTMEIAKRVAKQIGPLTLVDGDMVGKDGLRHQFNVSILDFRGDPKDYDARYVQPAVGAFVNRLRQAKVTTCGLLAVDLPGVVGVRVVSKEQGISLRGLRQYVIEEDGYRFDILVG